MRAIALKTACTRHPGEDAVGLRAQPGERAAEERQLREALDQPVARARTATPTTTIADPAPERLEQRVAEPAVGQLLDDRRDRRRRRRSSRVRAGLARAPSSSGTSPCSSPRVQHRARAAGSRRAAPTTTAAARPAARGHDRGRRQREQLAVEARDRQHDQQDDRVLDERRRRRTSTGRATFGSGLPSVSRAAYDAVANSDDEAPASSRAAPRCTGFRMRP